VFEITAYSVAKPVQKAQYLFASGTIPLPSLPWFPGVGLGGSSSGAGGMSPFHTSLPVELKDFQGTMTIHQRPGISLAGGNLEVDIASDALARLGAVVLPSRMLMGGSQQQLVVARLAWFGGNSRPAQDERYDETAVGGGVRIGTRTVLSMAC